MTLTDIPASVEDERRQIEAAMRWHDEREVREWIFLRQRLKSIAFWFALVLAALLGAAWILGLG